MDRARAEVKAAEERKRRRVQAPGAGGPGAAALAGAAAWWIDRERSQRRADQGAPRELAAGRRRRDVQAALNEVQVSANRVGSRR